VGSAPYQLFSAITTTIIIIYNSALYYKNEALVVEGFIHIFGMAHIHFSGFTAIPKSN